MLKFILKDKIYKLLEVLKLEGPVMLSEALLSNKRKEELLLQVLAIMHKVSLIVVKLFKLKEQFLCLQLLLNLKLKVYKDLVVNGLILF